MRPHAGIIPIGEQLVVPSQAPPGRMPPVASVWGEGADVALVRRARAGDFRMLGRSIKPLRWAAVIGAASAVGGTLLGLWIATNALFPGETLQGYSSLVAVTSFVDWVQRLDEQLFVFLNSLGSERWDGLWLFVTNKTTWMPFFVALMYLVYRQYGLGNMLIILALIVVMITTTDQLANIFKSGFERPRPCREEHLKEIIRYVAPRCGHYGFFSAHAANSMALAAFLGLLFRKIHKSLGLLLLFLSVIVSFSRIYLGVHYPLDTLTGWVIGALVGFLAYKLSCRINLSGPHGFS